MNIYDFYNQTHTHTCACKICRILTLFQLWFLREITPHLFCSVNPQPSPNPFPERYYQPVRTSTWPGPPSKHSGSSWRHTLLGSLPWPPGGKKVGSSLPFPTQRFHSSLCSPGPWTSPASLLGLDLKGLFPDVTQQLLPPAACVYVCVCVCVSAPGGQAKHLEGSWAVEATGLIPVVEEAGNDSSVCVSWFAMAKTSLGHLKATQTVFKQLKKWSKVFVLSPDQQPS